MRWMTILLVPLMLVSPAAGEPDESLDVPRALDGARITYSFRYTRAQQVATVTPAGQGLLALSVSGAAPVTDAGGGVQLARTYTFQATNFADLATHTYEALDGSIIYALDPVSGSPVQTRIDADVNWTSVHTPRLRYEMTLNVGTVPFDIPDSLLPVVRFLDALGDRELSEGEHVVEGPGPAMFAEVGEFQPLVLGGLPGRSELALPEQIQALPVTFVLRATGGLEVSGTAYLERGASLPAKLILRYRNLVTGTDVSTLDIERTTRSEGGPLPDTPPFRHPTSNPNAQFSPPLTTGTRDASWAVRPKVEDVVALSAGTPQVAAYTQQHPGAFVRLILNIDSAREAAYLGTVSPDLKRIVNHVLQRPFWILQWYAPDDPGIYVSSIVYPDPTGAFQAASQLGAGFPPPTPPERALTTSGALDLAEGYMPNLEDDGASDAALLWLSSPNVWLVRRGAGLDVEGMAAEPERIWDILMPQMGWICAYIPPNPGTDTLLDGEGGVLIGSIRARYNGPRVTGPTQAAECETDLVSGLSGFDLSDPAESINHLARDAQDLADEASTYIDTTKRPHAPIIIDSDSDFDAPSSISGVTGGSGTRDDPFVIAGWNIDADPSGLAGITLEGTSKHVVIRDNVLHGDGYGVWIERAANVRVEGNVSLGLDAGILVMGLSDGRVANNTARAGVVGIHVQNHITIDPSSGAVTAVPVERLEISGNRTDRTLIGLGYFGTYGSLVANRITDNVFGRAFAGIYAQMAHDTEFSRNSYNAGEFGVYMEGGGDDVTVTDELFASSSEIGLLLYGARGVSVQGGRFEDSAGYGLLLLAGAADVVAGRFDKNGRAAAGLFGSSLTVRASRFTGNKEFGAYGYQSQVDVRENWWGSSQGPSGCAHGAGDRISCEVLFDPWTADPPAA